MKNVVFLLPSFEGGGAERVMTNLIQHMDKENKTISIVVLKNQGVFKEKVPQKIPIYSLKSNRIRYAVFDLIKVLNFLKPDVVLSTLGPLNLFLIIIKPFLKSRPKIICREANTPSEDIKRYSFFSSKIYTFLYKKYYHKADIIISQCDEMKRDIEKFAHYGSKKNNIQTIYNPIDVTEIQMCANENFNLFNSKYINLITVGRLTYQKGYDLLLKSMNTVIKKNSNVRLYILGVGEEEDNLKKLIKKYELENSIFLEGFVDNPYKYIAQADFYILSSRWEGFPNVILESLVCETPVISFNCKSGPKEILEKHVKVGTLVDIGNIDLLSETISQHIVSCGEKANKKAFQDAYGRYEISKILKQYENLL